MTDTSAAPARLRRLEIQGFKSFAARTVFDFGPGITAIVGPNGSGKSNLADALRWALGEQNPRALRLRRLEDLIFAGGGKRAQAGFAEVTLVLDNGEGWLPVEFGEVAVTRRLHRSGESEYLINRRRVRLRDVVDLFLKARLGQNSYAILGQGMVDTVLSLRPDERRGLIEEAADVRRHRLKIDEATDQLAATRDNRDRVELLLAEIAPRLEQLERQARRAAEYARLRHELAERIGQLWSLRLRAAGDRLDAAHARLTAMTEAAADHSARVDRVEAALGSARADAEEAAGELARAEADWRRAAERQHDGARGLRERRERLALLGRRREEAEQDLRALEAEREELQTEAPPPASAEEALREAEGAIAARQAELRTADGRVQQAKAAALEAERQRDRARQAVLDCAARVARVEAEQDRLQREQSRLDERRRQAVDRLARWAASYREARQSRSELARRVETQRAALADAARRTRSLAAAVSQAESALLSLDAECEAARRRQDLLDHEREARRPSEEVVVALLDALRGGGPGRPRVLGILGGLLHVQVGFEVAIEAALGEALNSLVVRTEQEALAAVSLLRQIEAGRLTFYALDTLRAAHPLNVGGEQGVLGAAIRFVRCEPTYQDLFESLLGRILIVEDVDAARRVVRRGLGAAVTLDGTVVRPGGAVTGGAGRSDGYVFRAGRELEEAREALVILTEQRSAQVDRLAATRERLAEAAAQEKAVEDRLAEALRRLELVDASLAGLQRDLVPLRGELDWLRAAASDAAGRREQLQADLESAHQAQERPDGASLERLAAAAVDAQRALQSALEEQQAAGRRLSEARGHRAALQRELAALRSLYQSRAAARERTARLIAARREALTALDDETDQIERELERLSGELTNVQQETERLAADLGQRRERLRALGDRQRALAAAATAARAELEAATRARFDAELAAARANQELERLREQATEDGVQVDAEAGQGDGMGASDALPVKDLEERVRSLRARLRNLGAVNEEAEADYRESKERHDFLAAQVEDLRQAETGLIEALDRLRQIVRDQFRATFQTINADFQSYFRAFFGGGQARLVLTEPEDYGESGVDIVAQPPGKRLQNLAMLSGGERSMTAVALLFALLESNPAPFCVLDEVDAALDESNVGRFTEALTRLAGRGQFLVVTHNRGTVQAADNIYGVTMGTDGVSNVLSMRLGEAAPLLA